MQSRCQILRLLDFAAARIRMNLIDRTSFSFAKYFSKVREILDMQSVLQYIIENFDKKKNNILSIIEVK